MRETTFGDFPAAKVLTALLDEVPEDDRPGVRRRVSRTIHQFHEGLNLITGLPDSPHKVTLIQCWRDRAVTAIQNSLTLRKYGKVRTYAVNVIKTRVKIGA